MIAWEGYRHIEALGARGEVLSTMLKALEEEREFTLILMHSLVLETSVHKNMLKQILALELAEINSKLKEVINNRND